MNAKFPSAALLIALAASFPASAQVSFKVGEGQHSPAAESIGKAHEAVTEEITRQAPSPLTTTSTPTPPPRARLTLPGQDQVALQALRKAYGDAIQLKIESNWSPPLQPKPGAACNLLIRQLQGGEVVMAEAVQPCAYDVATKASLEQATVDAGPLPYRGFEPVFVRQMIFVFKTPTKLAKTSSNTARRAPQPRPAVSSGDYAKALQKHLMGFWKKPTTPPPPGNACTASFEQLPGGQVIKTSFDAKCFTNGGGQPTKAVIAWKKSIEDAGKSASPLPYHGFESVFKKTVKLTFMAQ